MDSFPICSLCSGARDTTREVTGIGNWGGIFSSGPNLNVVFLQPDSLVKLVKLSGKVESRDRSEVSVLNGLYVSHLWGPSCTARPILSTEDAVTLGNCKPWWTTTDLIYQSCREPCQCSCWHQRFQLRSSLLHIPFNSSNKLHSTGSPLSLWVASPPFSTSTA